ncbi:hypothetical protein CCAX7_32910 [Capsulimonas corticalis]|uniref:Uncharacterized protein n=1 Tax=Capsulimonas corticalis TaxID=2219043 RepID=A0A402CYT2_9BACT|nr:hypothetical protein [Capsulimonas corticalis]BDI31240.1 hypothetical protein CCAX7_32910 [Capsulimonas corticalis]
MRKANRAVAVALAGTIACGGVVAGAAHADLLGSVLKGGLVAVLIKQFAGPINDGINKLTGSAGVSVTEATKVVPIVSVGQGGYVGAAQVSGPKDRLDEVQAVGMLEGSVSGDRFRLKALVPIDTTSPKGVKLKRIKGVGVSAIVDIKV